MTQALQPSSGSGATTCPMASSSSLAQALVCAIALPYPNTASVVQIVFLHGLFVGAAVLFRSAGWKRFPRAEDAD